MYSIIYTGRGFQSLNAFIEANWPNTKDIECLYKKGKTGIFKARVKYMSFTKTQLKIGLHQEKAEKLLGKLGKTAKQKAKYGDNRTESTEESAKANVSKGTK